MSSSQRRPATRIHRQTTLRAQQRASDARRCVRCGRFRATREPGVFDEAGSLSVETGHSEEKARREVHDVSSDWYRTVEPPARTADERDRPGSGRRCPKVGDRDQGQREFMVTKCRAISMPPVDLPERVSALSSTAESLSRTRAKCAESCLTHCVQSRPMYPSICPLSRISTLPD